jgi:hypothetical protein
MYYIIIELFDVLHFQIINVYKNNLDKALSNLLDLYVVNKKHYILKIVPNKNNLENDGIMSNKYKYYMIKKKKGMYFINKNKNKNKIINFDKYPKTLKRLNRLTLLSGYSKNKLATIYNDLYGKNYIIRNKYLTLKSTYIKDIYRHENINYYFRNI